MGTLDSFLVETASIIAGITVKLSTALRVAVLA